MPYDQEEATAKLDAHETKLAEHGKDIGILQSVTEGISQKMAEPVGRIIQLDNKLEEYIKEQRKKEETRQQREEENERYRRAREAEEKKKEEDTKQYREKREAEEKKERLAAKRDRRNQRITIICALIAVMGSILAPIISSYFAKKVAPTTKIAPTKNNP